MTNSQRCMNVFLSSHILFAIESISSWLCCMRINFVDAVINLYDKFRSMLIIMHSHGTKCVSFKLGLKVVVLSLMPELFVGVTDFNFKLTYSCLMGKKRHKRPCKLSDILLLQKWQKRMGAHLQYKWPGIKHSTELAWNQTLKRACSQAVGLLAQ